jgi:hypothetical protein
MSKAFRYAMFAACGSFAAALMAGGTSYLLLVSGAAKDSSRYDFWGNLLLNLFAEFFGLAVGIFFAAIIARRLANEKLAELAPEILRLVAQLKKHNTINGEAARSCVICAVNFLSEDNLKNERDSTLNLPLKIKCPVCKEDAETEPIHSGGRRCRHCKLQSGVWNINLGRETTSEVELSRPNSSSRS